MPKRVVLSCAGSCPDRTSVNPHSAPTKEGCPFYRGENGIKEPLELAHFPMISKLQSQGENPRLPELRACVLFHIML